MDIHNGEDLLSENLIRKLQKSEEGSSDKIKNQAYALQDFPLDKDGLKIYQESLEAKLASRFPLLMTKSVQIKEIVQEMGRDRKHYDRPIHTASLPLWKHLNGKNYEEAKGMITTQLMSIRNHVQKQINDLSEEMNPNSLGAMANWMKSKMGLSRFDEFNSQMPESLAMHLAYSSVLNSELMDYSKKERLGRFKAQSLGKSDFHNSLDQGLTYATYYFLGVLGLQFLSWVSFFRVPVLKRFFPAFQRASSAFQRDGVSNIFGMALWRGQPITLFDQQQSWVSLGFIGSAFTSSGINLASGLETFNQTLPFLESMYENQVSCDSKAEYVPYSEYGCQMKDRRVIDAHQQIALTQTLGAAAGILFFPLFIYGMPKAMAWAQKIEARYRHKDARKFHEATEKILQDIGFAKNTVVTYNPRDVRAITYSILKDFYKGAGNVNKRAMPERIFLLTRYLQWKAIRQSEVTFWKGVDSALLPHYRRLGMGPDTAQWAQRYEQSALNNIYKDLQLQYITGRLNPREFERLSLDVQVIKTTLEPSWKMLAEASQGGKVGNYTDLIRYAQGLRTGQVDALPVIEPYQLPQVQHYGAVYVRAVGNAKNDVALLRLAPYEMSPEAVTLMKKTQSNYLKELMRRKLIRAGGGKL